MTNRVEIYALKCPDSGKVRYIGKANSTEKRLKSHISDSTRRNTPVYQWIQELIRQGKKPLAETLHITTIEEWPEIEKRTISDYKLKGYELLNLAIGGKEPFCSKETRQNNGRNNARRIHDDPKAKRLWYLKKQLMDSLRFFKRHGRTEQYDRLKNKLIEAAKTRPETFANLIKAL